jgi:hypothetical protein
MELWGGLGAHLRLVRLNHIWMRRVSALCNTTLIGENRILPNICVGMWRGNLAIGTVDKPRSNDNPVVIMRRVQDLYLIIAVPASRRWDLEGKYSNTDDD